MMWVGGSTGLVKRVGFFLNSPNTISFTIIYVFLLEEFGSSFLIFSFSFYDVLFRSLDLMLSLDNQ